MPEILKRWEDEIIRTKASDSFLSKALGVANTTIMRWRIKGMKPSPSKLADFEIKLSQFMVQHREKPTPGEP